MYIKHTTVNTHTYSSFLFLQKYLHAHLKIIYNHKEISGMNIKGRLIKIKRI